MPDYKPLNIAVFDLNLTVYNKSSKEEFFRFICQKRKEKALYIFSMSLYKLGKKLGLLDKTTFKENFFHYLDHIPPETLEAYAREFWALEWPHQFNRPLLEKIQNLRQAGTAIYFATGGLDCYVKPLFEEFIRPDAWLSTRTQYIDGRYKIIGKACKGDEKIKSVNQLIHPRPYEITEAYSDKNEPIMQVAKKAFLIKEGEVQRLIT